jgi:limonene 1,2-monooxygenase
MICVAATNPFGFNALEVNWQIANDLAAQNGRKMDPSRLRLVGPMHIAETRAQAFENVKFGFEPYLGYLNINQPRLIVPAGQDPANWFVENKFDVIGAPDDVIVLI